MSTPPLEWPAEALALVNERLVLGDPREFIQLRLQPVLGYVPSLAEVEAAIHCAKPSRHAPKLPKEAERPIAPEPVRPEDNPVRRVAPGTYPALAFSMLGGRIL